MSAGYVYILTNESMPGLVKIGKTTRCPDGRAGELDTTGVPTPFVVCAHFYAPDCHDLERSIHNALRDLRVRDGREFFRVEKDRAVQALEVLHREMVEIWLERFLPNHTPVDYEGFIDPSTVFRLADETGASTFDVAMAIGNLTGAEIEGQLREWRARMARAEVVYNAKKSVGHEH